MFLLKKAALVALITTAAIGYFLVVPPHPLRNTNNNSDRSRGNDPLRNYSPSHRNRISPTIPTHRPGYPYYRNPDIFRNEGSTTEPPVVGPSDSISEAKVTTRTTKIPTTTRKTTTTPTTEKPEPEVPSKIETVDDLFPEYPEENNKNAGNTSKTIKPEPEVPSKQNRKIDTIDDLFPESPEDAKVFETQGKTLEQAQKDAGAFLEEFFPDYYEELLRNLSANGSVVFDNGVPVFLGPNDENYGDSGEPTYEGFTFNYKDENSTTTTTESIIELMNENVKSTTLGLLSDIKGQGSNLGDFDSQTTEYFKSDMYSDKATTASSLVETLASVSEMNGINVTPKKHTTTLDSLAVENESVTLTPLEKENGTIDKVSVTLPIKPEGLDLDSTTISTNSEGTTYSVLKENESSTAKFPEDSLKILTEITTTITSVPLNDTDQDSSIKPAVKSDFNKKDEEQSVSTTYATLLEESFKSSAETTTTSSSLAQTEVDKNASAKPEDFNEKDEATTISSKVSETDDTEVKTTTTTEIPIETTTISKIIKEVFDGIKNLLGTTQSPIASHLEEDDKSSNVKPGLPNDTTEKDQMTTQLAQNKTKEVTENYLSKDSEIATTTVPTDDIKSKTDLYEEKTTENPEITTTESIEKETTITTTPVNHLVDSTTARNNEPKAVTSGVTITPENIIPETTIQSNFEKVTESPEKVSKILEVIESTTISGKSSISDTDEIYKKSTSEGKFLSPEVTTEISEEKYTKGIAEKQTTTPIPSEDVTEREIVSGNSNGTGESLIASKTPSNSNYDDKTVKTDQVEIIPKDMKKQQEATTITNDYIYTDDPVTNKDGLIEVKVTTTTSTTTEIPKETTITSVLNEVVQGIMNLFVTTENPIGSTTNANFDDGENIITSTIPNDNIELTTIKPVIEEKVIEKSNLDLIASIVVPQEISNENLDKGKTLGISEENLITTTITSDNVEFTTIKPVNEENSKAEAVSEDNLITTTVTNDNELTTVKQVNEQKSKVSEENLITTTIKNNMVKLTTIKSVNEEKVTEISIMDLIGPTVVPQDISNENLEKGKALVTSDEKLITTTIKNDNVDLTTVKTINEEKETEKSSVDLTDSTSVPEEIGIFDSITTTMSSLIESLSSTLKPDISGTTTESNVEDLLKQTTMSDKSLTTEASALKPETSTPENIKPEVPTTTEETFAQTTVNDVVVQDTSKTTTEVSPLKPEDVMETTTIESKVSTSTLKPDIESIPNIPTTTEETFTTTSRIIPEVSQTNGRSSKDIPEITTTEIIPTTKMPLDLKEKISGSLDSLAEMTTIIPEVNTKSRDILEHSGTSTTASSNPSSELTTLPNNFLGLETTIDSLSELTTVKPLNSVTSEITIKISSETTTEHFGNLTSTEKSTQDVTAKSQTKSAKSLSEENVDTEESTTKSNIKSDGENSKTEKPSLTESSTEMPTVSENATPAGKISNPFTSDDDEYEKLLLPVTIFKPSSTTESPTTTTEIPEVTPTEKFSKTTAKPEPEVTTKMQDSEKPEITTANPNQIDIESTTIRQAASDHIESPKETEKPQSFSRSLSSEIPLTTTTKNSEISTTTSNPILEEADNFENELAKKEMILNVTEIIKHSGRVSNDFNVKSTTEKVTTKTLENFERDLEATTNANTNADILNEFNVKSTTENTAEFTTKSLENFETTTNANGNANRRSDTDYEGKSVNVKSTTEKFAEITTKSLKEFETDLETNTNTNADRRSDTDFEGNSETTTNINNINLDTLELSSTTVKSKTESIAELEQDIINNLIEGESDFGHETTTTIPASATVTSKSITEGHEGSTTTFSSIVNLITPTFKPEGVEMTEKPILNIVQTKIKSDSEEILETTTAKLGILEDIEKVPGKSEIAQKTTEKSEMAQEKTTHSEILYETTGKPDMIQKMTENPTTESTVKPEMSKDASTIKSDMTDDLEVSTLKPDVEKATKMGSINMFDVTTLKTDEIEISTSTETSQISSTKKSEENSTTLMRETSTDKSEDILYSSTNKPEVSTEISENVSKTYELDSTTMPSDTSSSKESLSIKYPEDLMETTTITSNTQKSEDITETPEKISEDVTISSNLMKAPSTENSRKLLENSSITSKSEDVEIQITTEKSVTKTSTETIDKLSNEKISTEKNPPQTTTMYAKFPVDETTTLQTMKPSEEIIPTEMSTQTTTPASDKLFPENIENISTTEANIKITDEHIKEISTERNTPETTTVDERTFSAGEITTVKPLSISEGSRTSENVLFDETTVLPTNDSNSKLTQSITVNNLNVKLLKEAQDRSEVEITTTVSSNEIRPENQLTVTTTSPTIDSEDFTTISPEMIPTVKVNLKSTTLTSLSTETTENSGVTTVQPNDIINEISSDEVAKHLSSESLLKNATEISTVMPTIESFTSPAITDNNHIPVTYTTKLISTTETSSDELTTQKSLASDIPIPTDMPVPEMDESTTNFNVPAQMTTESTTYISNEAKQKVDEKPTDISNDQITTISPIEETSTVTFNKISQNDEIKSQNNNFSNIVNISNTADSASLNVDLKYDEVTTILPEQISSTEKSVEESSTIPSPQNNKQKQLTHAPSADISFADLFEITTILPMPEEIASTPKFVETTTVSNPKSTKVQQNNDTDQEQLKSFAAISKPYVEVTTSLPEEIVYTDKSGKFEETTTVLYPKGTDAQNNVEITTMLPEEDTKSTNFQNNDQEQFQSVANISTKPYPEITTILPEEIMSTGKSVQDAFIENSTEEMLNKSLTEEEVSTVVSIISSSQSKSKLHVKSSSMRKSSKTTTETPSTNQMSNSMSTLQTTEKISDDLLTSTINPKETSSQEEDSTSISIVSSSVSKTTSTLKKHKKVSVGVTSKQDSNANLAPTLFNDTRESEHLEQNTTEFANNVTTEKYSNFAENSTESNEFSKTLSFDDATTAASNFSDDFITSTVKVNVDIENLRGATEKYLQTEMETSTFGLFEEMTTFNTLNDTDPDTNEFYDNNVTEEAVTSWDYEKATENIENFAGLEKVTESPENLYDFESDIEITTQGVNFSEVKNINMNIMNIENVTEKTFNLMHESVTEKYGNLKEIEESTLTPSDSLAFDENTENYTDFSETTETVAEILEMDSKSTTTARSIAYLNESDTTSPESLTTLNEGQDTLTPTTTPMSELIGDLMRDGSDVSTSPQSLITFKEGQTILTPTTTPISTSIGSGTSGSSRAIDFAEDLMKSLATSLKSNETLSQSETLNSLASLNGLNSLKNASSQQEQAKTLTLNFPLHNINSTIEENNSLVSLFSEIFGNNSKNSQKYNIPRRQNDRKLELDVLTDELTVDIKLGGSNLDRPLYPGEAVEVAQDLGKKVANVVNQLLLTTHPNYRLLPAFTECASSLRKIRKKTRVLHLDTHDYPWMARIGYSEPGGITYSCAGTIITGRYILTSGHCANYRNMTSVLLENGKHSIEPYKYEVESVIEHGGFDDISRLNDIALIRLKTAIKFNSDIKPICLPFEDGYGIWDSLPQIGQQAIVAGWGFQQKNKTRKPTVSLIQDESLVTILPNANCSSAFQLDKRKNITFKQICGSQEEDECRGDGGAPLLSVMTRHRIFFQIGIVSFGSQCGGPRVYTKVSEYLKWILDSLET